MQCVYRAFNHTEAEIVADLLRVEGCPAWVFENGLSRLKWYQVIAFGGALVMVPDESCDEALQILVRWQRGDYCLDVEDDLCCPRCASASVEENPNYRGWAFFFGCFLGLPLIPMLKWRERCKACGYHWKATPPNIYAELTPLPGTIKARTRGR